MPNIQNPNLLKTKVITFSRQDNANSGDVAYTGVGFMPKAALFVGCCDASQQAEVGVAGKDLVDGGWMRDDTHFHTVATAISLGSAGGGTGQTAIVKSWDSDGFTLTWTKVGAPAGATHTFYALCFG